MNKVFVIKCEGKIIGLFKNEDKALQECEKLKEQKLLYFKNLYRNNIIDIKVNKNKKENIIFYSFSIMHKDGFVTGCCYEIECMEVK